MQRNEIRRVIGSGILALAFLTMGAVTPSQAQTPPGGAAGTPGAQTTQTGDDNDDDGMDLGWIGLLGLAGLLGLRRKDDPHVTRVDTTTGTGTTRPRV